MFVAILIFSFMKQLLKDIITDQKSFLSRGKTIERKFPESYLRNEEVIIVSGVLQSCSQCV